MQPHPLATGLESDDVPRRSGHAVVVSHLYRKPGDPNRAGGDYVDQVRGPGGALTLVVGDLWAKGAQGAYYAFRMRRAFRRAASESASPASILSALNDTLADDLEAHGVNGLCSAFVTTFSAHGNLICAAAGAEAAILFRDRDKHEHLGATGPLAGIERGAFFAELELAFSSGDALVAFTDGITESRFAGDEQRFLGTHGLVEIVRRVATARVLPAPRDVFREIEMWNGGNFRDDATLAIASPAEAP